MTMTLDQQPTDKQRYGMYEIDQARSYALVESASTATGRQRKKLTVRRAMSNFRPTTQPGLNGGQFGRKRFSTITVSNKTTAAYQAQQK